MKFNFSKRVPQNDDDAVGSILKAAVDPKVISLAGGLPSPDLFPVKELKKAADEVFDNDGKTALQYGMAAGYEKLREQVAEMTRKRGIECSADDVVITTGTEQSIDLVGKLLVNPGDTVLVEKPTYLCTLDVLRSYGAKLVGVDMDEHGMRMDALKKALDEHPDAKLLYTIPNFQNPTGRTMPNARREEMEKMLAERNIVILEDDPYGKVRYSGKDQYPVKHFDHTGNVIYQSSFSKFLVPGLRLGWIVADPAFIKRLVPMKQSTDLHSDNLSQYVVSRYLAENDIQKHVDQICALYKKRAETMMKELDEKAPKGVTHSNPEGGMFLWVKAPESVNTVDLFKECIKHHVAFVPGAPFYPGKVTQGTFRLNFSNADSKTIKIAIDRLCDALNEFMKTTSK
ncbi:PLP-dependent aminotransferase family protein [Lactobacillus sp. Sy-1]|uniref:aminotransferase-like domain-containing protein n=1 Tax=Lactobacillus sp. Sy-1 TaxID=2109645 RepID=UPI001C5A7D99|nr:PLP-dependent aminotransferase family protein [Lactobacillus sp. Sy-1]MBW1606320.1 PLP-dependent aminotransferase family protein [Lactobacillus sp. Sy-1]